MRLGAIWPTESFWDLKNKNAAQNATFLRLGTPFRLRKAEMSRFAADLLRFWAEIRALAPRGQSLIAKKLQNSSDFCFCSIQIAATEQIPRIRNGQIAAMGRIPPIRDG